MAGGGAGGARCLALALCLAVRVAPLVGQDPPVPDLGVATVVTTGPGLAVAVGPALSLPVSSRDRVVIFGGFGAGPDGEASGRAELLWRTTVPVGSAGVAPYAAGGLALGFTSSVRGLLVAVAGIEVDPGARMGWMLEAGVGGGLRLMAGVRWRLGPSP